MYKQNIFKESASQIMTNNMYDYVVFNNTSTYMLEQSI